VLEVTEAASRRLHRRARLRRGGGSPHLVYISIVGVDRHPLGYYRTKFAVERLVTGSGPPYSVLRATQFHDLILMALNVLAAVPAVMPLPGRVSRGFRDGLHLAPEHAEGKVTWADFLAARQG
jgi:uncharacterized protein YbjT (DUF2867 family)